MPEVCCILWNKIDPNKTMPTGVHPKHLLWALYFLVVYDTEHNSSQMMGKVDEKTYPKSSESCGRCFWSRLMSWNMLSCLMGGSRILHLYIIYLCDNVLFAIL
jgi:hypothetical protein